MVGDRLEDGRRIAELLASEITGDDGALGSLAVVDAEPDIEPTVDGALAFRIVRDRSAETSDPEGENDDPESEPDVSEAEHDEQIQIAEAYVHPDRVRLEFAERPAVAAETARKSGLRVRPKAVDPPRTIVFVEDGAQVKWSLPVFEAVLEVSDAASDKNSNQVR